MEEVKPTLETEATLRALQKVQYGNYVDISVEVTFELDLSGKAHIVDKKIVRNLTDDEQRLRGPFQQSIRRGAATVLGYDSNGNPLTTRVNTNPETSQLELDFKPPNRDFVIPAHETRSFTIEYDAFEYAERIDGGLVLKVHTGSLNYSTTDFDHFTQRHKYVFDVSKDRSMLQRLLTSYKLHLVGLQGEVRKEKNRFVVQTSEVISRRQMTTHILVLQSTWRKSAALVLASAAGATIRSLVTKALELLAR